MCFRVDNELSVKVADSGLSRDTYSHDYHCVGGRAVRLPIKWLPPESINNDIYNEKSDIVSQVPIIHGYVTQSGTHHKT